MLFHPPSLAPVHVFLSKPRRGQRVGVFFIVTQASVCSLCKANIKVSDRKAITDTMTRDSSSAEHSEQNRPVWLHAERSMLIFALQQLMIACVYLLGYRGTRVPESTKNEHSDQCGSRNLWTQQTPHSHCCPAGRCLLLCSFNRRMLDWSWECVDGLGVQDSSARVHKNTHRPDAVLPSERWTFAEQPAARQRDLQFRLHSTSSSSSSLILHVAGGP